MIILCYYNNAIKCRKEYHIDRLVLFIFICKSDDFENIATTHNSAIIDTVQWRFSYEN